MVVEHGNPRPRSIAKFVQESGSFSSFDKVIDFLEAVMGSRGHVVEDKKLRKMMIKTLDAPAREINRSKRKFKNTDQQKAN